MIGKKKPLMSSCDAGAELAVLSMVRRYEVLMMEDLIIGRPDFSWVQMILAAERLSRNNLIALRRVGPSYQIRPINREWTLGQEHEHEEPAAHHR